MAALIVDPSAILGLILEGEDPSYAEAVLPVIATEGAAAPSIFWYELRNVLLVSERRGRVLEEKSSAFLAAFAELPIELAGLPSEPGVMQIARSHGLTAYDAAYLDLAVRRDLPLATLDRKLRAAAEAIGAEVFVIPGG